MRWALTALMVFSGLLYAGEDAVETALKAAMKLARERKYPDAISKLRSLMREAGDHHPLSAEIRFRLAELYARTRQHKKSAETYELLRNFPGSPLHSEAVFRAGEEWKNAANYEKARKLYRSALERFKDRNPRRWWDCHWRIAETFRQEGKDDSALHYYNTMLRLNPDKKTAYPIFRERINLMRKKRRYDDALREIERAERSLPSRKEFPFRGYATPAEFLLRTRADILRGAGRVSEALDAYKLLERTTTKDSARLWTGYESAQILGRNLSKRTEAHAKFLNLLKTASKDRGFQLRVLNDLLWNAYESKRIDTALDDAEKVLLKDKVLALKALPILERFCVDRRIRKPNFIRSIIRKLLRIDFTPAEKSNLQARLLSNIEDFEEGIKELEILKRDYTNIDRRRVQLTEVRFYQKQGRKERAIKLYRKHIENFPDSPDPNAVRSLAELLLEVGEEAQAFTTLQYAVKLRNFGFRSWASARLVDTTLSLGKYNLARQWLQKALESRRTQRQKNELHQKLELCNTLETLHKRSAHLRLKKPQAFTLPPSSSSDLVIEAEVASLLNAKVSEIGGMRFVEPSSEQVAVLDLALNVAKPERGSLPIRFALSVRVVGSQPPRDALLIRLDEGGLKPRFGKRGRERVPPSSP